MALDRLSNAHFTPAAAVKTLAVVSTAPALAMEEALPISVSKETQQTPEEVAARGRSDRQTDASETKVLKGDSEKTQEERQRERRVGREGRSRRRRRRSGSTRRRSRKRTTCASAPRTMRAHVASWRTAR